MRCNNCGWNNADDAVTCVKCNNPLMETVRAARGSQKETVKGGRPAGELPHDPGPVGGNEVEAGLMECPHCNYPANRLVADCPACGKPMKAVGMNGVKEEGTTAREGEKSGGDTKPDEEVERPQAMRTETIDPFRNRQIVRTIQPEMVLEKVGRPDETSQLITFKAAGDQVTVNRANLDEGNFTITGKVQATFTFKDNKWWLSDWSDLKTTFIQVKEPRELRDGDIILMGDRRFIFYSSDPGKTGDATL
jgi:hypothetical protein